MQIPSHHRHDRTPSYSPALPTLSRAVRPAAGSPGGLRPGYRIARGGPEWGAPMMVLTAAVPAAHLLEAFFQLADLVGPTVDIVLESSHEATEPKCEERERQGIDLPVFLSHCCEFEDLLLEDGCTGLAVLNEERGLEVHLDEHKLIYVYAENLRPFESVLRGLGLRRDPQLPLVTEAEHIHYTHPRFQPQFEELAMRLGTESYAEFSAW